MIVKHYKHTRDGFGDGGSGFLDPLLNGVGCCGEHLSAQVGDEQLEMLSKTFGTEDGRTNTQRLHRIQLRTKCAWKQVFVSVCVK